MEEVKKMENIQKKAQ